MKKTKKKPRTKRPLGRGRNKFEARIDQQLRIRRVPFEYESEKIPYVIAGHYIPDFIINTKLGKIYLETKGHFRPEAKRKMAAVKKKWPDLDIRIIFYSFNKSNIRWATKHGFPYCFNTIPESWLEEFSEKV